MRRDVIPARSSFAFLAVATCVASSCLADFTQSNARCRLAIAISLTTTAQSKTTGGNNMNISRRHLTVPLPVLGLVAAGLLGPGAAQAAAPDEDAVAKRLEAFRAAQVAADAKAFDELCAPELSYSHSDAHIEDKATFIKNATAGRSKFLSLEYKDPWIRVVGDVAIVRFHWVGESEAVADGKKNSTNLHILMNWQKQGPDWKLLSRASTKL
jgi:ketosteroid isomerase-like protein